MKFFKGSIVYLILTLVYMLFVIRCSEANLTTSHNNTLKIFDRNRSERVLLSKVQLTPEEKEQVLRKQFITVFAKMQKAIKMNKTKKAKEEKSRVRKRTKKKASSNNASVISLNAMYNLNYTRIRDPTCDETSNLKNRNPYICYEDKLVADFKNTEKIKAFCKKLFPKSINKFNKCSEKKTFCTMCCDSYIGSKHFQKRVGCYKKCNLLVFKTYLPTANKPKVKRVPTSANLPEKPASGCVIVYEETKFQGKGLQICKNQIDDLKQFWDHLIGSIKVGDSTTATFYYKSKLKGPFVRFTKTETSLQEAGHYIRFFNSLHVENNPKPNCVIFYEKPNYAGRSNLFCKTSENTPEIRGKVSSVKIGRNSNLILFEDINAQGEMIKLRQNTQNLEKLNFRKIGSIQIYPKSQTGCAIFFEKVNYKGESQQVCNKSELNSIGWDSKIGSVKLGINTIVGIYNNERAEGKSIEVSSNLSDFNSKFPSTKLVLVKVFTKPPKNSGMIFTETNFKGKSFVLNSGLYDNLALFSWIEKIKSVKVSENVTLELFEGKDFKKKSMSFSADIDEVPKSFADRFPSSAKVILNKSLSKNQGCVTIFDLKNYTGKSKTLCNSQIEDLEASDWIDGVQSIKVSLDTKVVLYEKRDFKGRSLELYSDSSSLENKVSSLVISKGNNIRSIGPITDWRKNLIKSLSGVYESNEKPKEHCILVYQKEDYQGDRNQYCSNESFVCKNRRSIKSFKISPDIVVYFYDNRDYTGNKYFFKDSMSKAELGFDVYSIEIVPIEEHFAKLSNLKNRLEKQKKLLETKDYSSSTKQEKTFATTMYNHYKSMEKVAKDLKSMKNKTIQFKKYISKK